MKYDPTLNFQLITSILFAEIPNFTHLQLRNHMIKYLFIIYSLSLCYYSTKNNNKTALILTCLLTASIAVTLINISPLIWIGNITWLLTALVIFFLSFKGKSTHPQLPWTQGVIGFSSFVYHLFQMAHWPYYDVIQLLMTIPILLFIWSLFSGLLRTPQFSFLSILILEFILNLIN